MVGNLLVKSREKGRDCAVLRASSTQGGWQHFYVNERNACVVWFPDGGPLNPQFYGVIIGGLGCFLRHQMV